MRQKLPNIHCLVDKSMNMCESYLSKTYLKIAGASSCRCIGIARCLRYNRGSFTRFLGNTLGLSLSRVGKGHYSITFISKYLYLSGMSFGAASRMDTKKICVVKVW
jgi:hypothetical protein